MTIRLVAWREITERLRGRAFLVATLVLLAVVLGGVIVPGLKDETTRVDVGVAGTTPAALTTALRDAARAGESRLELHRYRTAAAGEQAVRDGRVDVLIVGGERLVWKSEPDPQLAAVVNGAVLRLRLGERTASLPARSLEPPDPDLEARETIAFVSFVVLLMMLMVYGTAVAEGVAQEKGTRVMELLICRARPRDLLAGKVLGIGVVGLGQMLLALIAGGVAIVALDTVEVPAAVPATLVWAVVWFALGYAFWSVAYAAVGALVSRAEDLQAAVAPLSWTMLLFALVAPVASEFPDAWYIRVASVFPTTAPFVMPVRVAVSDVAAWEIALAVGVTLAATYVLVRLGGAVYSGALLRTGARPRLRDVWDAARVQ